MPCYFLDQILELHLKLLRKTIKEKRFTPQNDMFEHNF